MKQRGSYSTTAFDEVVAGLVHEGEAETESFLKDKLKNVFLMN